MSEQNEAPFDRLAQLAEVVENGQTHTEIMKKLASGHAFDEFEILELAKLGTWLVSLHRFFMGNQNSDPKQFNREEAEEFGRQLGVILQRIQFYVNSNWPPES